MLNISDHFLWFWRLCTPTADYFPSSSTRLFVTLHVLFLRTGWAVVLPCRIYWPSPARTCSPLKALVCWQTDVQILSSSVWWEEHCLGNEGKFVMLYRIITGCSKFQTLKPTGSHSKGWFIHSCLPAQLWSRNVVSTCAFSVSVCFCECSVLCTYGAKGGRCARREFVGEHLFPIVVSDIVILIMF